MATDSGRVQEVDNGVLLTLITRLTARTRELGSEVQSSGGLLAQPLPSPNHFGRQLVSFVSYWLPHVFI